MNEAGATAAYHALRLGEGEITDIKPIDRRRTIRYLHAAGLQLMTGVEPVWGGIDPLVAVDQIHDLLPRGLCGLAEVLHRHTLPGGLFLVALLRVHQLHFTDFIRDLLDQQVALVQRLGHQHLLSHDLHAPLQCE